MDKPKTLRQLIEENPEWADMPVGIYRSDGNVDYVGWSGDAYVVAPDEPDVEYEDWEKELGPVVIFTAN